MPTKDIFEVTFEEVSPELKKKTALDYSDHPVIEVLKNGAVIKVPPDTRFWKLSRYMRTLGFKVRSRKTKDGLIIWIEKRNDSNA